MKVVQVNATCGVGSTGKICVGISEHLTKSGIENYILCGASSIDHPLSIKYANARYIKIQALKSHILGNYGFNSNNATQKIIMKLDDIDPDIVHLHNIHGHDCNLTRLLEYLKKSKRRIVWTFHDCWAFTAYCTHFSSADCKKWITACTNCPQARTFSWFIDRSNMLFHIKKDLLQGVDLTIVTPSHWLAGLVRQSFLKEYPVEVIHNGIDLNQFKPTESNFRQRYGLQGKYIVLGVAFDWSRRKGLDVFIELSRRLGTAYQIVLVGTNKNIDRQLPKNIISIHQTQNQRALAEIYTAANVFVNPTREDNFPTVNIEALACGTPVITYDTGGSPEMLDDSCGSVVPYDNIDAMYEEVICVCKRQPFRREKCVVRAREFDMNKRYKEYSDLWKRIGAAK